MIKFHYSHLPCPPAGFEEPSSLTVPPPGADSVSIDPDLTPMVTHDDEDDVFAASEPETEICRSLE